MDIVTFSAADIETHLADLALLFKDAIDHGASLSYLLPLDIEVARQFWREVAQKVSNGELVVLAAIENGQPIGSVQLAFAWQPNGRHRAEVQKLMVHTQHRRKGIATQLMLALENVALQYNRTLLILDTQADSGADVLYESLDYQRVGVIPAVTLDHNDIPQAGVYFYKHLMPPTTPSPVDGGFNTNAN